MWKAKVNAVVTDYWTALVQKDLEMYIIFRIS